MKDNTGLLTTIYYNNFMKYLLTLISVGVALNAAPFKKPEQRPEKPIVERDHFGQWLDKEGYVTDGPKIKNWVDTDRDRIDDRLQAGPGQPAGKKRPVVRPRPEPQPKPEPKPKPTKPTRPTKPGGDKEKPTKPSKPQRPERPELSTDLKDKLDLYKEEKDSLQKELKEVLKKLDKPSRGDVKEAIAKFHKDNKDRFDAHKELGKTIKDGLVAARPERPKKPEVPEEVKKLHAVQKEVHKALHNNHKDLREKLKDVTGEEKEELLVAFKEKQQKLHEELKNIQRQLREVPKLVICEKPTDKVTRPNRRPPPKPDHSDKTNDRRPSVRR